MSNFNTKFTQGHGYRVFLAFAQKEKFVICVAENLENKSQFLIINTNPRTRYPSLNLPIKKEDLFQCLTNDISYIAMDKFITCSTDDIKKDCGEVSILIKKEIKKQSQKNDLLTKRQKKSIFNT